MTGRGLGEYDEDEYEGSEGGRFGRRDDRTERRLERLNRREARLDDREERLEARLARMGERGGGFGERLSQFRDRYDEEESGFGGRGRFGERLSQWRDRDEEEDAGFGGRRDERLERRMERLQRREDRLNEREERLEARLARINERGEGGFGERLSQWRDRYGEGEGGRFGGREEFLESRLGRISARGDRLEGRESRLEGRLDRVRERGGIGDEDYDETESGRGFFGRGPKNWKRSDERIKEDVNEELARHPFLDATEIEVRVQNGEVTLTGSVPSRIGKRRAEEIAERVFGVSDVQNQVKVKREGFERFGEREVTRAPDREARTGTETEQTRKPGTTGTGATTGTTSAR
jgi:hypothetical protein